MTFNLSFNSVSELRRWLEKKNFDSGDPETYHAWLNDFFDSGNTITVRGEEFDFWACWELI